MLQSAGVPKVDKKHKHKNKQQIKQEQQQAQTSQPQHKPARPRSAKQLPPARLTLRDITVQQPADASADADAPKLDALRLKEEEPVSDDEKAESSHESGVGACVIT